MHISIDLGGTNTRVASSKDLASIFKIERFKSSQDISEERRLIKQAILSVSSNSPVKTISLGVPGVLDQKKRIYVRMPNYSGLNGLGFDLLIDPYFRNAHLMVQNDAGLAALAEAVIGAGKDYNTVAYLTLSTGVGGSVIHKPLNFLELPSYEPGHQIIIQNGRYNERCGQFGCLESYVSGTSFEQIYNVKPDNCFDEVIWDDYARHLASGVINVCSLWKPTALVFGGKVSNKFSLFYPKLVTHLKKQRFFDVPVMLESEFKDDAGIYGGLIYTKLSTS